MTMKIIITEEQNDKLKENLLKLIEKFGVLGTINRIGYEKFNSIYPDYFKNKWDKIELLKSKNIKNSDEIQSALNKI